MANSKPLVLVHTSMEEVHLTEDVNVMLSPQFYTLKKESLPIRYAYQAKRIAPSLFEGLLEEAKGYEYLVWKEEDVWVFIAYNLNSIIRFLKEKGFVLEQLSKLFFAQQSVDLYTAPLALGENEALLALEGIVVVVPRIALNEEPTLLFDDSFTPKKGLTIEHTEGSIFTLKQTVVLTAIFLVMAILFLIEGERYSGNFQNIENEKEALFETYPSLSSKYTRDSIMLKYKTLDKKERKKREVIKALAGMIFKGVTLKAFEMDEKKFSTHFSCENTEVLKRVKVLAKKNNFKTVNVSRKHDLKIEGTL